MSPATLQLISMILGAVMDIIPKAQEDWTLVKYWVAFCRKIIDENRDPTPEERAEAQAFALAQHNAVQGR